MPRRVTRSTAYAITRAAPGTRVTVLEKEPGPARHQTGRNSGVIHSGIYYRPGSLKAAYAVKGAAEMVKFCAEYGIDHAVTGKLTERNLDIADVVVAVAAEIGCTPAQLAVAWTLTNPAVASPVIGVRTPAQLEDNLGALAVDISAEQLARLNAVSAVPPVFPMDVLRGPAESMMFGGVKVQER